MNSMDQDSKDDAPEAVNAPETEDYYFDGPFMVFTAGYHLKRGTCCGSGCRHCPYRGTDKDRNIRADSD
jgi:hypothetical protein